MNQFAYRIYKFGEISKPLFSGAITGNTMECAVKSLMKRHNIKSIKRVKKFNRNEYQPYPDYYFSLDGVKVGILIYPNPEDFTTDIVENKK